MPIFTLFALDAGEISVSSGETLGNSGQGDASHLDGLTITLNSNAWTAISIDDGDANFEDNEVTQTLNGNQTFGGVNYFDDTPVEAEYTVTVEDPDGNEYTLIGFNINAAAPGAAYSTVEGLAFVGPVAGFPPINTPLLVTGTSEGPTGSTTPYAAYASPPCFCADTLIETADGPRPVRDIMVGDRVRTLDNGLQPVRWTGQVTFSAGDLRAAPDFRPIEIDADAFGPGIPLRPIRVSPQHRIVVDHWKAEYLFGEPQVLVPAKHLTHQRQVRVVTPKAGITYVHLLFDAHQLIWSEGLLSESFHPGQQSIGALAPQTRAELMALFPELTDAHHHMIGARRTLTRQEARLVDLG
ncbi:Hint domain-containing protein [Yoonia sp. SS1-5]|uniref:Hint domain-containing protein n=1 Tax=Yoonia rhodophyticola TaxID=3137370 RepID=A0AAN0MCY7_9RHOB